MASSMHIRPANLQDAPRVLSLLDELENTVSDPLIFDSIFKEYLADPDAFLYVAEDASAGISAFISCKGQNLLHHQGKVFEIQELIVTMAEQGKGIGRTLINQVREEVQRRGAKSLEVTSNKRRKEAHAFYQSVGFSNSHEKFTIYF
jgi:ribosomal protein S18 acetylase RimI-like enzyme